MKTYAILNNLKLNARHKQDILMLNLYAYEMQNKHSTLKLKIKMLHATNFTSVCKLKFLNR